MAFHWTLVATLSCLTSFFRKLTCHISSLPLSRNNRIPSCPTSFVSLGGATPTPPPVKGDVLLPITDEAISNVRGNSSAAAPGSPQVRTFDWSQPGPLHPIAVQFQSQQLGKAVLGFVVPMTAGLFLNQYQGLTRLQASAIAIALSVGFTATWNGMLLHGICPRAAGVLEYFGVVTILVDFFEMRSLRNRAVWNNRVKIWFSMNMHAGFNRSHGYMERALRSPCIAAELKNSLSQSSL